MAGWRTRSTSARREQGLKKKAAEISTLCGVDVCLLGRAPDDMVGSPGRPEVEVGVVAGGENSGRGAVLVPPVDQNEDFDLLETMYMMRSPSPAVMPDNLEQLQMAGSGRASPFLPMVTLPSSVAVDLSSIFNGTDMEDDGVRPRVAVGVGRRHFLLLCFHGSSRYSSRWHEFGCGDDLLEHYTGSPSFGMGLSSDVDICLLGGGPNGRGAVIVPPIDQNEDFVLLEVHDEIAFPGGDTR